METSVGEELELKPSAGIKSEPREPEEHNWVPLYQGLEATLLLFMGWTGIQLAHHRLEVNIHVEANVWH